MAGLVAAFALAHSLTAFAQGDVIADIETALPKAADTNSAIRRLTEDVYEVGSVRLDKRQRTITFPAIVNMNQGAVEYAIVHAAGKVHESVLKTDADALHIQLAQLLLKPAGAQSVVKDPQMPRELVGPRISIHVEWREGEQPKRARLEQMILNKLTSSSMAAGAWVFNGSRTVDGTFLAQRDGSIVAIMADGDALINNPRPGRNQDDIWDVNAAVVPAVGTAVQVVIELALDSR